MQASSVSSCLVNTAQNPVVPSGRFEITVDPFKRCPDSVSSTVLSYLSFTALLTKVCCVSKRWQKLASNPHLLKISVYQEVAFSQWTRLSLPTSVKKSF